VVRYVRSQGAPSAGDYGNVLPFDEIAAADRLNVSLDGFEGPLDLLLNLARTQKVDLSKISILELAEQYLQFIADARSLRLEIAADYLVTAAWLAFLKSKLLLPVEAKQEEGPSGEEMALHLAFRLKRLEAMREAVARLFGRKQLGVDFFARGMPEGIRTVQKAHPRVPIYVAAVDKKLNERGYILPGLGDRSLQLVLGLVGVLTGFPFLGLEARHFLLQPRHFGSKPPDLPPATEE